MVSNPASTMAYANPTPQREEVVPCGRSQGALLQQRSEVSARPDRETQCCQHSLGKQPVVYGQLTLQVKINPKNR